jgi:hypothetical protein
LQKIQNLHFLPVPALIDLKLQELDHLKFLKQVFGINKSVLVSIKYQQPTLIIKQS